MASGPGSREDNEPPVLPVKQRRSRSSRLSSEEPDCLTLSPVGHHIQSFSYNDVFPEPTDCHAAQCPIHQRYDPQRHQERFFSDGTPPPVPKKRLARTLSLPVSNAPSPSPLSPLQRPSQSFDNPLYMLAPIPDAYFHEETDTFQAVPGSLPPSPTFSQLSFDTLEEQLPHLFSSIQDQRAVFQGIQHRQLLFLRSMAQSVEARTLLQGEAGTYQPQDFLLCEGHEPKQIGDVVYFSLHSPRFPGRQLALRVHKNSVEASPAHTGHQTSHVNIRYVIAHFQPSHILRNDCSFSLSQHQSCPSEQDCTAADPPAGGSTESDTDHGMIPLPSIKSLLQQQHSVTVERDMPHTTLEDFVEDRRWLQGADYLDYDRQVCVLLLQVIMGLQHLYKISGTAAELRPQDILLVWPSEKNEQEQVASETVRRFKTDKPKGKVQMLWRTHGSPRVVLTPLTSALVPQPLTYIKSQIGALIQYCLHSQESLGSVPPQSSYSAGLLHVASLLQSGNSGPHLPDMVAKLQVLLWGPRMPLSSHGGSTTNAVHIWLTIKRALLVMKLAERGLVQDQSALDWEGCMSLQYLAFTDAETIVSVASQLWDTHDVD